MGVAESTAFLFPGQGSQRVGMGHDLVAEHPWLLERYYRVADEVLGLPLTRLCFEGPEDQLKQTELTQPAVFLTSMAILGVLRERGIEASVVAGHSLGEYSALVAAGVLEWTDALRLVRRRGELMASANRVSAGAMAAVLGLSLATVQDLCDAVQARLRANRSRSPTTTTRTSSSCRGQSQRLPVWQSSPGKPVPIAWCHSM